MSKTPPGFVHVLQTIDATPTRGAERAMLLAALRWVNISDGRLWPSIGNWAQQAGITVRTAQRALRGLEAKGLMLVEEGSSGGVSGNGIGRTVRYRMLPQFGQATANPDVVTGFDSSDAAEPRHNVIEPPQRRQATPSPCHPNPDTVSPNLSIQPSNSTTQEPSKGGFVFGEGDGWMGTDGTPATLERALVSAGIRGAYLKILAGTSLTSEIVEREARLVREDRNVRKHAAVLAKRLADLAGVELKKSPGLSAGTRAMIAKIEEKRRQHKRSPPFATIADALNINIGATDKP